ncbi:MAG: glycosyltransferase [Oceanospirillaceae bacterium]|nr:glycosyltransferase [Oceanospirillaceae bacterium]
MKVLHIAYSDSIGGASVAAMRLHTSLIASGIKSTMLVVNKTTCEDSVVELSKLTRFKVKLFRRFAVLIKALLGIPSTDTVSFNLAKTGVGRHIRLLDPDIINIHWPHGEMASIDELVDNRCSIVWTMHDEWLYNGIFNYTTFVDHSSRQNFIQKYLTKRLIYIVEQNKEKLFLNAPKRPVIVGPSNWITRSARKAVKNHCGVNFICLHNTYGSFPNFRIDSFNAHGYRKVRLLFGATGGGSDPRKGFDFIPEILRELSKLIDKTQVELHIFGGGSSNEVFNLGYDVVEHGLIESEVELGEIYRSANLFLMTSRLDNLPNTVLEAGISGTPTIAFDVGGVGDLIPIGYGAVVDPFDCKKFARAIVKCLENTSSPQSAIAWRKNLSEIVCEKYSSEVVSRNYRELYESIA